MRGSPPVWSACMCETTMALRRRAPSLAIAASMAGSEPGGPPSMRPVQEPDLMTLASPCPTSTKTTVVAPEEAPEAPLPAPPDAVEPVGVADGVGWGVFGVLAGDGSAVGCADGTCVAAPVAATPPEASAPEPAVVAADLQPPSSTTAARASTRASAFTCSAVLSSAVLRGAVPRVTGSSQPSSC